MSRHIIAINNHTDANLSVADNLRYATREAVAPRSKRSPLAVGPFRIPDNGDVTNFLDGTYFLDHILKVRLEDQTGNYLFQFSMWENDRESNSIYCCNEFDWKNTTRWMRGAGPYLDAVRK